MSVGIYPGYSQYLTCISSATKSRYASVSGYLPWVLSISHLYKFSYKVQVCQCQWVSTMGTLNISPVKVQLQSPGMPVSVGIYPGYSQYLTCISSATKSRYASVSVYLPCVISISHLYKFSYKVQVCQCQWVSTLGTLNISPV